MPVALPYEAVLDLLQGHGAAGPMEGGDTEIAFPPDQIAHYGLLAGDAARGAQCIAFVRPVFGDALRRLVFELMSRFGATVFDDALGCAYVMEEAAELPPAFATVCVAGVQRISSPQQLWPAGLSVPIETDRQVPALIYPNPNPQGVKYVMFDRIEPTERHLHMDFGTRAAACNPGTLRALRQVLLKVDRAQVANPEFAVSFHFTDAEANLLLLESPKIAEAHGRATMVVPGEVMLGAPVAEPAFVMDADWFFSNRQKAAECRKEAQAAHGITIAPGLAGVAALDQLLERLHQAHLAQRGAHPAAQDGFDANLQHWASQAGACLGEIIRSGVGGQWGAVPLMEHRHPVVRTHTGRNCWPKLAALNRIMNGSTAGGQGSIAAYMGELLRNARSATPRNADIAADIPALCHILLGHGQFGNGGLPLQAQIPVARLDFSLDSLKPLDTWLAAVHAQHADLERQVLSNLCLAAGAYLGETVRRNAKRHWNWCNYEDFHATHPAAPGASKSVNNCVLLIGPEIAALPMQTCNVGAWGEKPHSVHAHALQWLAGDQPEPASVGGALEAGAAAPAAAAPAFDFQVDIAARVAELKPLEHDYLKIAAPPWIRTDPLQNLVDSYPTLLRQGRVVWAHLVQANNVLFQPGAGDAPAEVVYDPRGLCQPDELAAAAQGMFKLKGTRPNDAEEARVAEHLTAEISRAFAMPVPQSLSSRGLLASTLLIFRKHLPNRRLSLGHFPVLISDACPGCVMILPGRWWPRAFAEEWGIEEEKPAQPAAVSPPNVRVAKDQLLHVIKPPVPADDEGAWEYLDTLLEEEEARRLVPAKGMLGKLLGRKAEPEERAPDPVFAKYLGQMTQAYPGVCNPPEDIGGRVLTLLVASASVNYVVETARREFGLTVFDSNHMNIVYRPAPKQKRN